MLIPAANETNLIKYGFETLQCKSPYRPIDNTVRDTPNASCNGLGYISYSFSFIFAVMYGTKIRSFILMCISYAY